MTSEPVLTALFASKWIEKKDRMLAELQCFASIEDEAAQILGKSESTLWLNGLTRLTEESAAWLCRAKYCLNLDGLTSLAPNIARHLGACSGELHLNGLASLSPHLASLLAGNPRVLSLNGLQEISQEVAAEFVRYDGRLRLDGIASIAPEASQYLKKCGVSLRGLRELSIANARNLYGPHRYTQHNLDGVESVDEEVAEYLERYGYGRLSLEGLRSFAESSAHLSLARQLVSTTYKDNHITLLHLEMLPASIAAVFGSHRFFIKLGIRELPPEVAAALVKTRKSKDQDSALVLNKLECLTPETAKVLAKHKAPLYLNGLTHLCEYAARELAKHNSYLLSLDGLADASEVTLEHLASHEGPLSLGGVKQLRDADAVALAKCPGVHLCLRGLKALSPSTCSALRKFKGTIGEGVAPMGERINYRYSKSVKGIPFLGLDGVSVLAHREVEELSKFKGKLSLSRIVESLTELSSSDIDVALSQLLATRTHDLVGLSFRMLRSLSIEAATELAKYAGALRLPALSSTAEVLGILRSRPSHSTVLPSE